MWESIAVVGIEKKGILVMTKVIAYFDCLF